MNLPKLRGAIGLAVRAGKCLQGADACQRAVRAGKVRLLLVDPSASENTLHDMRSLCEYYHCPWIMLPQEGLLEDVTGGENRRVLAVKDDGFAQMIRKYTE